MGEFVGKLRVRLMRSSKDGMSTIVCQLRAGSAVVKDACHRTSKGLMKVEAPAEFTQMFVLMIACIPIEPRQ